MAQGNDDVCSQSFTEETTNTQRQLLVAGTLTYPPLELPTLPFDLFPEILCRLPVKLLIQLRCVCKFFNSLISDPKFAKKHLQLSTKRHHLMLTNDYDYFDSDHDELVIELVMYDSTTENKVTEDKVMYDSPILSLFSTSDTVAAEPRLYLPSTLPNELYNKEVMCSCDGMFCGELNNGSYYLWNPSIRKFKLLPPLENRKLIRTLSFGYDHFIDNYKVVAVSDENEVCINTLGTDYWRKIEDIPYPDNICGHGVFVSGTVNWFASDVIISLHLENESYQNLCLPDSENNPWTLGVVMDCLCGFAIREMSLDVWILKEYGNKESWTKLYTVPNLQVRGLKPFTALYISEDDQLLVRCIEIESSNDKLVVYNPKTGTSNIPEFQNNYERIYPNVYIESLISP